MKTFGLTGGVGMGKSTAAKILRTHGVSVVDTDEIAYQLVQPGEPALKEISIVFGEVIIDSNGRLCREELARIVFTDAVARQKLEAILHPRISAMWREKIESWREEKHSLAVVVIPLLFEIQAENCFDEVICVACSVVSQNQRLLARGWNVDQIRQRNAAQWPVSQKIARADIMIWTEGANSVHQQQWEQILKNNDFSNDCLSSQSVAG